MLHKILSIVSAALVLASCSSAYKGSQTPDDVYYSPARPVKDAYAVNERRDNRYNNYDNRYNNGDYDDYTSSSEDMYLRMKIQNRYRWGMLDDFDYWNMPGYSLSLRYGYGGFNPYVYNPYVMNNWYGSSFYSPFWGLNSLSWFVTYYPMYSYGLYNPYYNGYGWHSGGGYYNPGVISKYPTRNPASGVSRPSLNSYRNGLYNNNNRRYNNSNNNGRTYTPSQTGRYNNNSNNNNSYTPSQPTRSYTPSSSGSSSSSGGSAPRSGGGVSRPPR